MRKPIVAGNWKMNGSLSENQTLMTGITQALNVEDKVEVVVCPPNLYVAQVAPQAAAIDMGCGVQTVSAKPKGAVTGKISTDMVKDLGCHYSIIGHSERRATGQSDAQVAKKTKACLDAAITPIVCLGESFEERESGITEGVVSTQLDAVMGALTPEEMEKVVIAYEPIWAIGTGLTATPEQAQAVHAFIRKRIADTMGGSAAQKVRIVYGGSMNPSNAEALLAQADIDGGLIGGASLDAVSFVTICHAAKSE